MAAAMLPPETWQHLARASTATVTTQLFILSKVERGAPLPGTYPPNAQTLEEYRAWLRERGGS